MALTRRSLLLGSGLAAVATATGAVAVNEDVLPGRSLMLHHLGLDGPDGVVPGLEPGELRTGVLRSAARGGKQCEWALATPAGSPGGLPVVVVLHGRGNDQHSVFDPHYLGLDRFLAAVIGEGVPPFALASVNGDEAYWHARKGGDDPAAMIIDEFLPLLQSKGLDTDRIGLMGWSMGGYGALHIAGLLGVERVSAVAALSPALWHSYADTAAGAFDGEDDFSEATVMGRQSDLAGIPVRVDCGTGDPFCSASQDYTNGFATLPAGGFQPGDHDIGYWRRMAAPQLTFVGSHLGPHPQQGNNPP